MVEQLPCARKFFNITYRMRNLALLKEGLWAKTSAVDINYHHLHRLDQGE